MLEYEKFQELQAKSQKMQEDYERQLHEMEQSRERALEELTEYYETKLHEMSTKLEQVSRGRLWRPVAATASGTEVTVSQTQLQ